MHTDNLVIYLLVEWDDLWSIIRYMAGLVSNNAYMINTAVNWTGSEVKKIQSELSRMLKSDLFSRADQQSRFLRFIVEETLTGGGSRLNQFVIGIEVFNRDESFDPAIDSIVRVEAGRLRSKLREYYSGVGSTDPLEIILPKGTYTVNFLLDRKKTDVHDTEQKDKAGKELDNSESNRNKNVVSLENPVIAVLPFGNLSNDPEQEYFADGITEDLITDISKIPGVGVIARNSTFTYKNKAVKVQQIGEDLGVNFVMEGSVRKSDNRIRITAQLVNTLDGDHLWAERYDRDLDDIFSIQDDVVKQIVSALKVTLSQEEQISLYRKGTRNLEAYDCVLRGADFSRTFRPENIDKASVLFRRAINLDPGYSEPYARLALVYVYEWIAGLTDKPETILDEALKLAQNSVTIEQDSTLAHSTLGWVYLWRNDNEKAIEEGNFAIELDQSHVRALGWMSIALAWEGRTEHAMQMVERAIRLNPIEPYYFPRGLIYYMMDRHDEAVELLVKSTKHDPDFIPTRLYLASSLILLGREDEGREQTVEISRINPDFTLASKADMSLRFKDKEMAIRFSESLKLVGLM